MRLLLAALVLINIAIAFLLPAFYEADDIQAFPIWADAERRLVESGDLTVAVSPDGEDRSPESWWLQRQLAPGLLGKGHSTRTFLSFYFIAQTVALVVLLFRAKQLASRPTPLASR